MEEGDGGGREADTWWLTLVSDVRRTLIVLICRRQRPPAARASVTFLRRHQTLPVVV